MSVRYRYYCPVEKELVYEDRTVEAGPPIICLNDASASIQNVTVVQHTEASNPGSSGSNSFNFIFIQDSREPYLDGRARSYSTACTFYYQANMSISRFIVIASTDRDEGHLRIFDYTHGHTICEKSFTNERKEIIDLGTLSNLPNEDAVFELQYYNSRNRKIYIYALSAM